jgi:ABC transporter DrrB family efflux protein
MSVLTQSLGDGAIVAKRNLIKVKRVPDLLVFSTLSPIMFVLLFAYVFGSAIPVPGLNYREFLMAGIFAQTVVFGSTITGASLAEDLQKGIIDRFRSLPMSRAAVLLGRTTSDLLNNLFVLLIMVVCGLAVGWRIHTGPAEAAVGFVVLLLFGYAISWVAAVIGLSVSSVEVAQSAGLIWMFPLTFVSTAFVAADRLPGWLQPVSEWNPISAVALTMRDSWGNAPDGVARGNGFPADHPLLLSLIWIGAILVVFMPLAISRYRRAASR